MTYHPVIPAGQLRTGAERVYAPLGFDPLHDPHPGALQVLTADLRAYYGDAVMLDAVPVISWRLHPVVMRLPVGIPRVMENKYIFCTPLMGPMLDLVWYVQGAVRGNSTGWQLSNGSYFIYHRSLLEPIK